LRFLVFKENQSPAQIVPLSKLISGDFGKSREQHLILLSPSFGPQDQPTYFIHQCMKKRTRRVRATINQTPERAVRHLADRFSKILYIFLASGFAFIDRVKLKNDCLSCSQEEIGFVLNDG
jgi:hypothetical protein